MGSPPMRTRATIGPIVLACVVAPIGVTVALAVRLGLLRGLLVSSGIAVAVLVMYRVVIRQRHVCWGATDEEVGREMFEPFAKRGRVCSAVRHRSAYVLG